MALKTKGIVKAGPKKRRARNEAEAIRLAVEENKRAVKSLGRASGKTRKYQYKEVEQAHKKAAGHISDLAREHQLRLPKVDAFTLFRDELEPDMLPFARQYWQMSCDHVDEQTVVYARATDQTDIVRVACKVCGSDRLWFGTMTRTKQAEWMTYCPDGFDQWDWQDLYDKDRSLWYLVHDEALASMLEETMTKEDADA